jgi:hypothetical protein
VGTYGGRHLTPYGGVCAGEQGGGTERCGSRAVFGKVGGCLATGCVCKASSRRRRTLLLRPRAVLGCEEDAGSGS